MAEVMEPDMPPISILLPYSAGSNVDAISASRRLSKVILRYQKREAQVGFPSFFCASWRGKGIRAFLIIFFDHHP